MAVLDFDPGCTAAAHETSTIPPGSATCDYCGVCLRCFGTRVLEHRDGGLVAAAPDTPVKTEFVQERDLEGVTSELVFFLEGGFLVLAEGQALACFCLDRRRAQG